MDLTSPITAANAAAPVSARAPVAGPPDYAARVARFDALSAAVLDGATAQDQRLQAYSELQAMSAGGQLIGLEPDRRQVLDQATYDSDIGQRAQQLSKSFGQAVNAAGQSGGAAGALKAAAAAFDNLSAPDQAILFATTINAADRLGQRPYADAQAWRANTEAQSQMVDYMQASGVVGANGQLDYRAAAAKSGDVRFAAALKLSQRRDNNSAAWTGAVQQLFGAARAPDRLDLSPAAQKALDAAPQAAATPATAPYRAGSLVSAKA